MCTSPLFRHKLDGIVIGYDAYKDAIALDPVGQHFWQRIGCGQCMECRLNLARQWMVRNWLESLDYPDGTCWFITLTYDPESLDSSYYVDFVDDVTGEIYSRPELHFDDFQRFKKRMDQHYGHTRYFGVGEYGPLTLRPHYHFLCYGVGFSLFTEDPKYKLTLYKYRDGRPMYNCEYFSDIWGYGFVTLSLMDVDNVAYCSRYCLKKLRGRDAVRQDQAQEALNGAPFKREFNFMSRRPGIGSNYFNLHKDEIYNDDSILVNLKKPVVLRPFRYYDKLYDLENPLDMAYVKQQRVQKMKDRQDVLTYLGVDESTANKARDINLKSRIKALRRDGI